MPQPKPPSLLEQAEQRQQEEALRVAKSIQTPGQTKEQTRLIAKGIEKGIALYKQQEKAKARERDKSRKRSIRQQVVDMAQGGQEDSMNPPNIAFASANPPLLIASALFSLVALLHLLRYLLNWQLIFQGFEIPLSWSLAAALLSAGLAFWLYWSAREF